MNTETIKKIIDFRDRRDWKQFHTPYNLAASISIEAAELLEIFQWSNSMDPGDLCPDDWNAVADEIADVTIYVQTLALDLGINIEIAVLKKLALNERRYPVAKCKGRSDKYTEYENEV